MHSELDQKLGAFIRSEWDRDVPSEVTAAASEIAAHYGDSVMGVLFYGSCLRTGEIVDKILDFYVIVETYQSAYKGALLAIANKILPPNVFYHEMDVNGVTVRSKYAVLSVDDLAFRTSRKCLNVSVWARFCQPCMLLLPRDDLAFAAIHSSVVQAVKTMLLNLLDLKPFATNSRDLWVEAFGQTYAAELRSERGGKGLEIYLLDQERYDQLTPIALAAMGVSKAVEQQHHQPSRVSSWKPKLYWWARRVNGKIVSFLRLIKATTTFDGGIDYIAWKIRRHSGVEVDVTNWMRKWPVIAGITLFWKLRKRGAFK